MRFRPLTIPDCLEITPVVHADDRGTALEWFRADKLEQHIGYRFSVAQSNMSVSNRGVLRGINVAPVPPGKARYVTVAHGSVVDFLIDVRVGSPTFGTWDSVLLDDRDHRAVFIPEGVGHAFVALTETATMTYVTSTTYDEVAEVSINPLDPDIGLRFPNGVGTLTMTDAMRHAPSLADRLKTGSLPSYASCRSLRASP